MIEFDIVTIFPKQIESFISEGVFRIGQEKGLVNINVHNLRKWTHDNHKSVDDTPFGGGAGMVIKPEPVYEAVDELKRDSTKIIITTPRGKLLKQNDLKGFSTKSSHYIILAGHYEGFDERIHELADYEVSIGEYVLSGGELPTLILIDGIIRLLPGVLGNSESLVEESFEIGLEYPQYTRPKEFRGKSVPEILLSGNHKEIKEWRKEQSEKMTKLRNVNIDK